MSSIFQKPSWYHGVYPAGNGAATIRDFWFNFLGSTSGFPYSAAIFNQAFFQVDYTVTGADVDLQAIAPQWILQVLDSDGNLIGQTPFSITPWVAGTGTMYLTVDGTFQTAELYTVQVINGAGTDYRFYTKVGTESAGWGSAITSISGSLFPVQTTPYDFALFIAAPQVGG